MKLSDWTRPYDTRHMMLLYAVLATWAADDRDWLMLAVVAVIYTTLTAMYVTVNVMTRRLEQARSAAAHSFVKDER